MLEEYYQFYGVYNLIVEQLQLFFQDNNRADISGIEISSIIRKVNAGYGKHSNVLKRKYSWWINRYDATYEPLQSYRLSNLINGLYVGKYNTNKLDPNILDKQFDAAIKGTNLTYKLRNTTFELFQVKNDKTNN